MSILVHTFDVFDTVLTRTVCDPHATFLLVGQEAVHEREIGCSAAAFKEARVRAEREARKRSDNGEVTLSEIYACLGEALGLGREVLDRLEAMELAAESRVVQPVPVMASKVAEARARFGKAVFLSDMYLPTLFLRDRLRDSGLFQEGDVLWVSGDRGVSKASGRMYEQLLVAEKVRPKQVCHWGDHASSDVTVPRRLGIAARSFNACRPNRYECILETYSESSGGASSFLAGASRLERVSGDVAAPRERALQEVAAGVVGPALLAYVMWILNEARRRSLARLYFLARDGQILLSIARLCAPAVGYDGELKYLHASRQSWRLPASEPVCADSLEWALEDTDQLSPRSFLERVGLRPEDIGSCLGRHGFPATSWEQNLAKGARLTLGLLMHERDFLVRVAREVRARKGMLLAYLAEQGVLDGCRWGLVDLGWHGTLQRALGKVLGLERMPPPIGFYFGLSKKGSKLSKDHAVAYFYDERCGAGMIERNYWIEPMMEVFCAADHGLTIRFEQRDGHIEPVLKNPRNEGALAWGLRLVQRTILNVCKRALTQTTVALDPEALRLPLHSLFGEFWNFPTSEEAEAWGTFPYADDQTESASRQWAERFGPFDWFRSVYRGQQTPPHRAGWGPGGMARSSLLIRSTLPGAVKAGRWVRGRLSGEPGIQV